MGRWWPLLWCWFSLISKLQKCLPNFPYFLNFCTSFRSFNSFGISKSRILYQPILSALKFYFLANVVYKHSLLDLERYKNKYYVRIFLLHQYQANILLLCQSVEFPYPCKNNCLKFYTRQTRLWELWDIKS